jgi:hypothetical protein
VKNPSSASSGKQRNATKSDHCDLGAATYGRRIAVLRLQRDTSTFIAEQ